MTPEVKVGQVWEEVDPRMTKPRTITVLAVEGDKVKIRSLSLFHDWDRTGEYAMECPRMGVPRPHLDGETFCDRCNQELS